MSRNIGAWDGWGELAMNPGVNQADICPNHSREKETHEGTKFVWTGMTLGDSDPLMADAIEWDGAGTIFVKRILDAEGNRLPYSRRFLVQTTAHMGNMFNNYANEDFMTDGMYARLIIEPSIYNPSDVTPYSVWNYTQVYWTKSILQQNPGDAEQRLSKIRDVFLLECSAVITLPWNIDSSIKVRTWYNSNSSGNQGSVQQYDLTYEENLIIQSVKNVSVIELPYHYDVDPPDLVNRDCYIIQPNQIKDVLDTSAIDTSHIHSSITKAASLVSKNLNNKDIQLDIIKSIAMQLALHYTTLEIQNAEGRAPGSNMFIAGEMTDYSEGLDTTQYGRKAIEMDPTGTLEDLGCG